MHSRQHRTSGAERTPDKATRGHTCPWTCLSGTSVSPPHPCIQSPLPTGTRKGGMSAVPRAEPGLTRPPLGWDTGPCPCWRLVSPGCTAPGRAPQPCCPRGSVPGKSPRGPTPQPAGCAAPDTGGCRQGRLLRSHPSCRGLCSAQAAVWKRKTPQPESHTVLLDRTGRAC